MREEMAQAGRGLKFLPYAKLDKMEKHAWGALRAWPK